MVYIVALCFAVFSGCVIYLCLKAIFKKRLVMEKRMQSVMNRSDTDDEETSSTFSERIFKPILTRMLGFVAMLIPQDEAAQDKLSKKLKQAGLHISAKDYSAAVLMFTIFCVAAFVLVGLLLEYSVLKIVLAGVVGVYAGMVVSRFWLKSKITRRKNEIYHQLPEVLDLLSVSVAAGLGFDQALSYVVKKSRGALINEFDTAQREISLGRPRKEALERLADRCDSIEIYTFVSAIIQADEMGASIKNVLQIQASTIRETHKQNVEEKVQKLSVKMLIPMVLFIFPVMFIVLLGPAVPSVIEALSGL